MQFNTPDKQKMSNNNPSRFGKQRMHSMQLSRQISDVTSQMSQSVMSTVSTKEQVGKAKDVILKALHLKQIGFVREQTELISAQPFMKGTCNERHLRIWMKAFIEQMGSIVNQFKDQRLLELLLFDLPWLCHGVDRSVKIGKNGGFQGRSSSQLPGGQISAFNLNNDDGISQSQRSLFSQGAAGTSLARMPSLPSDFNGSSQGGGGQGRISATNSVRSSVNPIHAKNATMNALLTNSNWSFSPCCTHGY